MGRTKPAVIYLRVAPQLREALRRAAETAGVSVNAYSVQVLAAALGLQLQAVNLEELAGANVVDILASVPLSTEDHRRATRLAEAELRRARARFLEHFWKEPGFGKRQRSMSDADFLEWFRREELPFEADPHRYEFHRGGA